MGRALDGYTCAYFPRRGVAGWIEASRLEVIRSDAKPALTDWLGRWSDQENPLVRFLRRGGKVIAKGDAAWPEFNPSREVAPGGPNVGAIDEPVRISGNQAYAAKCGITFTLLGDILVAADPAMRCGGVNVSFSGVYERKRR